ncbi:MAG: tRNA wybutosine-synthesizing 3 family protein [Candidatus Nanoarchaeia archaeon]
MARDGFKQRKQDTLNKLDKSSKGHWDKKISKLCDKINIMDNYYTTSSCSGRIVIMVDGDKKSKNLFIKIYHDLLKFEDFKKDLGKITKNIPQSTPNHPPLKVKTKNLKDNKTVNKSFLIKFKQEPCILHVACKDFKGAQRLYNKAKLAGWKKSGIIASGKRFVVELNSTERIEFPIVGEGKLLIGDDFLKAIVKKTNENLKKSWKKIEKLEKSLK